MKIGIIGSGNFGGTLTRRLKTLGHDVKVANSRGPQSLTGLSEETGAKASTIDDAARDADLVVIAVPVVAVPMLPADAFRDKVVVDANNYNPERDGDIMEIADRSLTSSRWTAAHLPGARVIKAFNNIYAQHLGERGRPPGQDDRIALPVAGDDAAAKRTVMAVVEELGFDPVDAGTLDESWRQQPDTPVYGTDHDAAGVRRCLASARP
ncbi:MAG: 8-hydroxy-5-deazaflavin:NADPH oxidoreductase [Micromonosporaceae bacterium]|jgi:predicted dinucleotide-binding enzyme|nr:8-hydroxy-5-deazaflavin:NADPH oxidoreductase [Micromonosporaceae bacterium]